MKFLLITASKIAKSFQTFPDISTGIGRWYQSDHKYSGLSAATTGYNQTTIDQGTFHGQNCQNDGKVRPRVPRPRIPKKERGCPKSRIAPFAIVYFGKKNYLTVAKKQTL